MLNQSDSLEIGKVIPFDHKYFNRKLSLEVELSWSVAVCRGITNGVCPLIQKNIKNKKGSVEIKFAVTYNEKKLSGKCTVNICAMGC